MIFSTSFVYLCMCVSEMNEVCFVEKKVRTLKRELALPSFTVRFLFRDDREFIFSSRAVQNVVNPVCGCLLIFYGNDVETRERERDFFLPVKGEFDVTNHVQKFEFLKKFQKLCLSPMLSLTHIISRMKTEN